MTFEPNRLMIESAEVMAVELSERGEKWAAQTIAGLLNLIEGYEARESSRRQYADNALLKRLRAAQEETRQAWAELGATVSKASRR